MQVLFLACLVALVAVPAVHAQVQEPEEPEAPEGTLAFSDFIQEDEPEVAPEVEELHDEAEPEIDDPQILIAEEPVDPPMVIAPAPELVLPELEITVAPEVEEVPEDEDTEAIQFTFDDEEEEEEEEDLPVDTIAPPVVCELEIVHERVHADGGVCQADVEDEDACKALCMDNAECAAMDWDYSASPYEGCHCWAHFDAVPELLINDNRDVDHAIYIKLC